MRDPVTGAWIPARRNSKGIKCCVCHRVFAGEIIPIDRVCRDCRDEREAARQAAVPPPLFP